MSALHSQMSAASVYRLRGNEGSSAMAMKAKKKAAKKASTVKKAPAKKAPAKKAAKPPKAAAKAKGKPASAEPAAAPAKVLKPLTMKQRLALIRVDPTTGRCPHNLVPETCAFCMSI